MTEKTFTQEEINEITNKTYLEYVKLLTADKMDYKDLAVIENVIMKIQIKFDEMVKEDGGK